MKASVASIVALGTLLGACDGANGPAAPPARSRILDEQLALPSDDELDRLRLEAIAIERTEDLDRALDAKEPGEQLEHATLSQVALDRGVFGPADLLRVGDALFAYPFRPEQGLGNALAGRPGIAAGSDPAPNLRRVQAGEVGGPDASACAECHGVGGDDGAGTLTENAYLRGDGDHVSTADARNAPAVLGLGPVELLAAQISSELADQRELARTQAAVTSMDVTWPLVAEGLTYGSLIAHPDGSVDTSQVTGVSGDLVVRPFGWKGHQATLRSMIKEAFRAHMGIVSVADQQGVRDGVLPVEWYGDGPWYDVDRDGTTIEVDDGMVSTMVGYLAQLEVPIVIPPADPLLLDSFARGRAVFDRVECSTCHTPALTLRSVELVTHAEQSENVDSPPTIIDVARDGREPKIEPVDLLGSAFTVRLFSDLRRHDMGAALASPIAHPSDGGPIAPQLWLTRSLWGLADTAPYLHDGRALTVEDAILAHGGEGQHSRDLFAAASDRDRADVLVFLLSLRRSPRIIAR
jgi:mono/diheme cytochrome c family protein